MREKENIHASPLPPTYKVVCHRAMDNKLASLFTVATLCQIKCVRVCLGVFTQLGLTWYQTTSIDHPVNIEYTPTVMDV